jgi:hypothetical protein
MKTINILFISIIFAGMMMPVEIQAIPAFARKYGFNCAMCHTAYPKLNDFGQRFRDNGYQIPGQQGNEKTVFDSPLPISLRTSFGSTTYNNEKGTTTGFNLYALDFLAAGVLHKNISFLMIYTPRIDDPANIFSGPDSTKSNAVQLGTLESVSLIFSNIIKDALNIRIGRFEPAYHVFSSKRSYYLFEPYEIYTLTTPNNSFVFDDNQIGIEATGHFKFGLKYAAGFVNGNGGNPDNNNSKDIYLNIVQTIGRGDGQSAGQRIGVFGFYGWQPLDLPGDVIDPITGNTNGSNNNAFYRYGATGSFNWKTLNLQLMYMKGVDDKAFNSLDPSKSYEYSGGIIALDYAGLFNNRLVASAMYNWRNTPSFNLPERSGHSESDVNAYSLLVRYYLGDLSAINIAIHAEYTYRVTGYDTKFKENIFALALDFAL